MTLADAFGVVSLDTAVQGTSTTPSHKTNYMGERKQTLKKKI